MSSMTFPNSVSVYLVCLCPKLVGKYLHTPKSLHLRSLHWPRASCSAAGMMSADLWKAYYDDVYQQYAATAGDIIDAYYNLEYKFTLTIITVPEIRYILEDGSPANVIPAISSADDNMANAAEWDRMVQTMMVSGHSHMRPLAHENQHDLGEERAEWIKTNDHAHIKGADPDWLHEHRASNKVGTTEHRFAQANKGVMNAWNSKSSQ